MSPTAKKFLCVDKPTDTIILPHYFNHQADLLLPSDLYESVKDQLSFPRFKYYTFTAPPSAILESTFFNKYIKTGDILLLSKGRIDTDDVISLNNGTLRLALTKETYERAGLQGKPAAFKIGRLKQRWLVERDLREAAMVSGRKGFDRLKWSFETKFTEPKQFIFCDLEQFKRNDQPPHTDCPALQSLDAKVHIVGEDVFTTPKLKIPKFFPPYAGPQSGPTYEREDWADWTIDLLEYIGLASIPADRLLHGDKTDTFLSRYDFEVLEVATPGKLTRIRWRGLLAPQWLKTVWETARDAVASSPMDDNWATFTVLGIEDAPISWGVAQHSQIGGAEGEHGYILIQTPSTEESATGEPALSADKMEVDEKKRKPGPLISCEFMGPYDEHS